MYGLERLRRKKQESTQRCFCFCLVSYMHLSLYHVSSLLKPQPLLFQLLVPILLFHLMPCCLLVLLTVLVICFDSPGFPLFHPFLTLSCLGFSLPCLCPLVTSTSFSIPSIISLFTHHLFCLILFARVSLLMYRQSWLFLHKVFSASS